MTRKKAVLLLLITFSGLGMAVCAAEPSLWPVMVAAAAFGTGLLYWAWHSVALTTMEVVVVGILMRLMFVPLEPGLSDDAYRYVWDGYLQVQGVDPYAYKPADEQLAPHRAEPVYDDLNSADFYSVYPPVSQLVFRVGAAFHDHGWRVSYYTIKGIFLLLEIGALLLLSRMVSARSLMLYAWQPLVWLEVAGQAHTEAALVFFLVAIVWAVAMKRPYLAGGAVAAAGWVKLYPFLFIPFVWRRAGWRSLVGTAVVGAVFALPYAGHIANMFEPLDLYVRYFEYNSGLYLAIKRVLFWLTEADWSKQLGPFLQYIFLSLLPVLYILDWRADWSLAKAMRITMGAFFLLATTVHPWYLLGIIALMPFGAHPGWHWHVLALGSIGTYLFYVGGPYAPFVALAWGGWLGLILTAYGDDMLQWIQRQRGVHKARVVSQHLPAKRAWRVLDLGAAEGYVGEALAKIHPHTRVTLADVLPLNRTSLPFVACDGRELPFRDDDFDVTVLVFVLHHTADPGAVIKEAMRVSTERVVILESVYEHTWQEKLLRVLDTTANRIRSYGGMKEQEEHLHFRRTAEWIRLFEEEGACVKQAVRLGNPLHRQALFVLAAS